MQLQKFLIELVASTDGWVIVLIFSIYAGYHIYKKHSEGVTLSKTLNILENTITSLLENVDRNISSLTSKIDLLISKE